MVVLWVTGAETVDLTSLPWAPLCGAAALSLGCHHHHHHELSSCESNLTYISAANLLANFSILITYENFITLGLVAAVPASAGDHDHHLDEHHDNDDRHRDYHLDHHDNDNREDDDGGGIMMMMRNTAMMQILS